MEEEEEVRVVVVVGGGKRMGGGVSNGNMFIIASLRGSVHCMVQFMTFERRRRLMSLTGYIFGRQEGVLGNKT